MTHLWPGWEYVTVSLPFLLALFALLVLGEAIVDWLNQERWDG